MKTKSKIVMGIDPGTNRMGYGIIEVSDSGVKCIVMGDIELGKLKDPYSKLHHIFERISALIDEYSPNDVALEAPFFGENVQSMLKLGRAQGVAMAAALNRGIPVFEYAPMRIKQAITGRGGATKQQVATMLRSVLGIDFDPKRLDATDGLAVALCHHYACSSPIPRSAAPTHKKRSGSWTKFIADNPNRVKRGS